MLFARCICVQKTDVEISFLVIKLSISVILNFYKKKVEKIV